MYTKSLVYLHFYTVNKPESQLLEVLTRKNEGKAELYILKTRALKVSRTTWHGLQWAATDFGGGVEWPTR